MKRSRSTRKVDNTGGAAAPQYDPIHRRKKTRRRSRRVLDAMFGPAFTGTKASSPVLSSLKFVRSLIPYIPFQADKPNQWLLDVPKVVWTYVIIPYFGLKDLFVIRAINQNFFKPYWLKLFLRNQIPLRIPHDIPLQKLTSVAGDLKEFYEYTHADPLVVQVANGTHTVASSLREGDVGGAAEINYLTLPFSMSLVGENRDATILECGLLLTEKGYDDDFVLIKNLTVRGSKKSGIRGMAGSFPFAVENVLIEDCNTCGLVAQGIIKETTCTNVEIRNCGWSGIQITEGARVVLKGPNTSIYGNCTGAPVDAEMNVQASGLFAFIGSFVDFVHPLTKEVVSKDNYLNNQSVNWGGGGLMRNIVANQLTWGRLVCLKDHPLQMEHENTAEEDKRKPQEAGEEYELQHVGSVNIGRRPDCDVVIADSTVSGHHCVIKPVFDTTHEIGKLLRCTITNTSSNGTFLNGTALVRDEETKLWYGDVISLCHRFQSTGSVRVLRDIEFNCAAAFEFKEGLTKVGQNTVKYCYNTPER